MDAKAYNEFLVSVFQQQLAAGNDTLSTNAIIKFLFEHHQSKDGPLGDISEVDVKRYEAELQKWIEDCRSSNESGLEAMRGTITAGQNALKTAFLMNGGASVAVLAFLGHLATVNPAKIAGFAGAMLWFVMGVVVTAIASGTTYLSQWFYSDWQDRAWTRNTGMAINVLSILLGLSSYALFVRGAFVAYAAFISYA